MDAHVRHAVYITFNDLFQRYPSKQELVDILGSLSARTSVMAALRLNNIFRHCTGRDSSDMVRFQSWFVQEFLDSESRDRLLALFGNADPKNRPVCHPLQLLYFAKLASVFGRDDEEAREESLEAHRAKVGKASLIINDLFSSLEEQESLKVGTQNDKTKEVMVQSLASWELSNPTPVRNLFVRAYVTYCICLKQPQLLDRIRKECGGFDLEATFENLTGMHIMGWLSIVAGLYLMLREHSLEDFISQPDVYVVNRKSILANSLLSTPQINNFFDSLSMTFDEFKRTMNSSFRRVDERLDILPFRARPMLNFAPDVYSCFDPALLAEQLHSGPYFRVWAGRTKKDQNAASRAWGLIFERYVQWLLDGIERQLLGKLYADTIWDDNGERSFDAVLIRARTMVVFEYKGGFLSQEARYSNDSDKFMEELKDKFGKGGDQLARNTARLLPFHGEGRKLRDVNVPKKVEFVLPVLVVQEPMLRFPFINYFLNLQFQEAAGRSPVRDGIEVLPLNVLHITSLEGLVEMAESLGLDIVSVLFRRSRADKSMRLFLNDFLDTLPEMKRPHRSLRFDDIFKESELEMSKLLTGKDPAWPGRKGPELL